MADKGGSFLAGLLLGGIVGGVAALLVTPKTGREIRDDLSEDAEKILARAKEELEHAKKIAMDKFEEEMEKIRHDDDDEMEEADVEVTAKDANANNVDEQTAKPRSRRGRPRKDETENAE